MSAALEAPKLGNKLAIDSPNVSLRGKRVVRVCGWVHAQSVTGRVPPQSRKNERRAYHRSKPLPPLPPTQLCRVDFNVPQDKKTGAVTNTQRIDAAIPTIQYALAQGAKVRVQGRARPLTRGAMALDASRPPTPFPPTHSPSS